MNYGGGSSAYGGAGGAGSSFSGYAAGVVAVEATLPDRTGAPQPVQAEVRERVAREQAAREAPRVKPARAVVRLAVAVVRDLMKARAEAGLEVEVGIYPAGAVALEVAEVAATHQAAEAIGGGGSYQNGGSASGGGFGGGGGQNSNSGAAGGGGAGFGGAIFNQLGTVTAMNCSFITNTAIAGGGYGMATGGGGAVFNLNGAVTLESVTYSGNTATTSGGTALPGAIFYNLSHNGGNTTATATSNATLTLVDMTISATNGDLFNNQVNGTATLLLVLLMAGLTATLTGCGSANGFVLQIPQTYTLTVTATSGTLQHSQTVTLIMQ